MVRAGDPVAARRAVSRWSNVWIKSTQSRSGFPRFNVKSCTLKPLLDKGHVSGSLIGLSSYAVTQELAATCQKNTTTA